MHAPEEDGGFQIVLDGGSPPLPGPPQAEVTRLLCAISGGDAVASEQLLPLVYDQLRRIAQQKIGAEHPGHTLQATALVHEAYVRLVGDDPVPWSNRAHFVAAAAEAMRRILIEHARRRGRIRHGGGRLKLPLSVVDLACECDPDDILALDDSIRRLEEQDPRAAQVVRLRFYAGLSIDETAAAMDLSPRTVKRDWEVARAWLYRAINTGAVDGASEPGDLRG
jgi:RNA polymerase sigma factor (TIGR02999 family)